MSISRILIHPLNHRNFNSWETFYKNVLYSVIPFQQKNKLAKILLYSKVRANVAYTLILYFSQHSWKCQFHKIVIFSTNNGYFFSLVFLLVGYAWTLQIKKNYEPLFHIPVFWGHQNVFRAVFCVGTCVGVSHIYPCFSKQTQNGR